MNKKTIIIGLSSIALIGAGIGTFLYFKNRKDNSIESEEYGMTEDEITKSGGDIGKVDETEFSSKDKIVGSKDLKMGSKGRRVAILQALLNHYEGQNLTIDGAFGNKTRLALLAIGGSYLTRCAIPTKCEVTIIEFNNLLKKTKNDASFKKEYNPTTNKDMKAVYNKYSS